MVEGLNLVSREATAPRFVVHKHAARRLHYDFRLEANGVLLSWAVPKGPSYDPRVKRLAVHVEDHQLEYGSFEGVIPGGRYGSGAVLVWDEGTYRNLTEKDGQPVGVTAAVAAGHLSFWLSGTKLRGGWSLTRTGGPRRGRRDDDTWILVKRSDETADPSLDITTEAPNSAVSGLSIEDLERSRRAPTIPAGPNAAGRAEFVTPMLATGEDRAGSRIPLPGGDWVYERKYDGLRCLAVRNGAEVRLWSRNRLSFDERFPTLVAALARLPADRFTLDGEIVAFDGDHTSFGLLQQGGQKARPVFRVFDVVSLLGRDTTGLPLADRHALVLQAVPGGGDDLQPVEWLDGDEAALLERACASGWEGLVAKQRGSTYQPGRSRAWRKLKCTASQELVIGGWTDPNGARTGLGAILVGYYDPEGPEGSAALAYAGKVGTGFDQAELASLHAALSARASDQSPFAPTPKERSVHWVRPELVAQIRFREWTREGRLRHPSYEGLRPDKDPTEVSRDSPDA